MNDTVERFPHTRVLSDRKYKSGQGYEMTYEVKVRSHAADPWQVLRVIARRGNRDDYTAVKVERWNGEQWHAVVSLPYDALPGEGPSYVCWDYLDRRVNGRSDCEEWLDRVGDYALALAMDVIL